MKINHSINIKFSAVFFLFLTLIFSSALLGQPTKRIGLITTTISKPKFFPIPVLDAEATKNKIKKIADTLVFEENKIIDSLRMRTAEALEKITAYSILYADELQGLPNFDQLKEFTLPVAKTYGKMLISTKDKNIFPVRTMKAARFFKRASNYKEIAKKTCEMLDLDAIVYCNWRMDIMGVDVVFSYGSISSSITCNFFLIGKDGNLIFEGFCFTNSVEVSINEPLGILKALSANENLLDSLVEKWTRPKNQKKLQKKGL